jgi:2-polyprenyl-3-methyl-5-hydroxy-6-metoxy-1,4-benzoquinol methylase
VLEDRKEAERAYPQRVDQGGREWLRTKPFGTDPAETARLLADFALVVSLLELKPGVSLCELGCGPGWITRLAARQGVEAVGYDISPEMIEIAREQAAHEGVDASFEVADMEQLDPGRQFDACLVYDALHHTPRADLVLASARRVLEPGGRLLLVEPNRLHRFAGRGASDAFGTTELGYGPRRLRRLLREAGFADIERFHAGRRRAFGNRPRDLAAHLAQPFLQRALASLWPQIWLRGRAA